MAKLAPFPSSISIFTSALPSLIRSLAGDILRRVLRFRLGRRRTVSVFASLYCSSSFSLPMFAADILDVAKKDPLFKKD